MSEKRRQYGTPLVRCCDRCGKPQAQYPKGDNEPLLVFCRECVDHGEISVYGYKDYPNQGYWTDGFLGPAYEF